MATKITAKWDTGKGNGFEDGQRILLFGFDANGQWDRDGQPVPIHQGRMRVIMTNRNGRQVWAGGVGSRFWATPDTSKRNGKQASEGPGHGHRHGTRQGPRRCHVRTSSPACRDLKEGDTFLFHGDDRQTPAKRGVKLALRIVGRVWITG